MAMESGESRATTHYPRNATQTRARMVQAAQIRFARESFDQVSVRDIATDAGVDAALINRYFGSKEKLFAEVISGAFRTDALLQGDISELGMRFASHIMSDTDGVEWREGFDPLLLLLRSATNPQASAIVGRVFHEEFVLPLASKLKGEKTTLRAGLIASYILGLATMRVVLNSPTFEDNDRDEVSLLLGKALQTGIDDKEVSG